MSSPWFNTDRSEAHRQSGACNSVAMRWIDGTAAVQATVLEEDGVAVNVSMYSQKGCEAPLEDLPQHFKDYQCFMPRTRLIRNTLILDVVYLARGGQLLHYLLRANMKRTGQTRHLHEASMRLVGHNLFRLPSLTAKPHTSLARIELPGCQLNFNF